MTRASMSSFIAFSAPALEAQLFEYLHGRLPLWRVAGKRIVLSAEEDEHCKAAMAAVGTAGRGWRWRGDGGQSLEDLGRPSLPS